MSPSKGHPATTDGLAVSHHVKRFHHLIRDAYALERWQVGPKRSDIRKAQEHKRAVRIAKTRSQLADFRTRHKRLFDQYRAAQEAVAKVTPFDCGSAGSFAVPCAIVGCESQFIATARNTSSTAGGYYQVIDSTWYAYGGSRNGDSHPAAAASPLEQHQVASRLYQAEGTSPWNASAHCWS